MDRATKCSANHRQAEPHRRDEVFSIGFTDSGRVFVEFFGKRHRRSPLVAILVQKARFFVAFCPVVLKNR
jgi:hypothetical protein